MSSVWDPQDPGLERSSDSKGTTTGFSGKKKGCEDSLPGDKGTQKESELKENGLFASKAEQEEMGRL